VIEPAGSEPSPLQRVRRAALRVLPVLLVAGGIWWWFRAVERQCEPLIAAWADAFEASIRAGEPRLPAPGRLADELLRERVERALAVPVDPAATVRVEASSDSGGATASWIDRHGARRHLELRCDGTSVVVRGVGIAPRSSPLANDEEAR
jgi:hypothetical protein